MSDYDYDQEDDVESSDEIELPIEAFNDEINLDKLAEELMELIGRYPELSDDEKDHLISIFPSILE
jgi:hypothetical protein